MLKRHQLLSLSVFVVAAALATLVCYLGGQMSYLAPLMASAAVLANAGTTVKPVLRATLFAYMAYLLLAALASLWLPAVPMQMLLLCATGFLLGMILFGQHPPALALLAVLSMHPADIHTMAWLMLSVMSMLLGAMSVHLLPRRWIVVNE